ncbi:MAG: anhydro-N-acetylmuramic acid kinase [Alphaproteobacteria bacterium]
MSGTSADGVDAALLRTDGERIAASGPGLGLPYADDLGAAIRGLYGGQAPKTEIARVAQALTEWHAEAIRRLLAETDWRPDLIGFHGQTILHEPEHARTWQIGDGQLLADLTGVPVVNDLRSADVAAGGQGAPLAPLYHAALAADLERPLAVLNIGGVANVTWLGAGEVIAFDTGPGNAMVDDWMRHHTGQAADLDGALAATGKVHDDVVAAILAHPYFQAPAPKSLDRDAFSASPAEGLTPADGAATLTMATARSVALARDLLPRPPTRWLVCGGGRHNPTLMRMLAAELGAAVEPVEAVGWRGDLIEAEAFAFLAVRSMNGLPTSLPSTTGAAAATVGGRLWRPR